MPNLESCKALLELDKKGVLSPHGLGGLGRQCLEWAINEIERLQKPGLLRRLFTFGEWR